MAEKCWMVEPWSVAVMTGVGGGHWTPDVLALESEALTRALQVSLFEAPKGPEFLARESEALTTALQASLSHPIDNVNTNHQLSSYLSSTTSSSSLDLYSSPSSQMVGSPTTPSSAKAEPFAGAAAASDSDSPTAGKKARPASIFPGRVSKRRPSRASRRTPTTVISADPANFRQMVQQVTGVQIPLPNGTHLSSGVLSRPEPLRAVAARGACIPTLDSSAAFLLQGTVIDRRAAVAGPSSSASSPPPPAPVSSAAFSSGGLDMGLPCFPTLESSWEVM